MLVITAPAMIAIMTIRPRAYDPQAAVLRARDAFWRAGYSGTSLDDVSAATGMNRPSLYAAFGDKRTLYLRALEDYWRFALAALREDLTRGGSLAEALMRCYDGALDDRTILLQGCGLTVVAERSTARADQVSANEFAAAAPFERKIRRHAPRFIAFLGKPAYSALSGRRDIVWGRQGPAFGGAVPWVLPNPSGRNRSFSLDRLVDAYRQLYIAVISSAP